ncbi:hypothetical protein [Mesorhizobium sp.]|uniref:hypothetical protein n=1 Tax=Mesorhizobium sp. TaxID=1871066 RepID=UPI0025BC4AC7|nr:hypothetical protein [Mesorhizobium sp.]
MLPDTITEAAKAKFNGAYRGRRLSWSEFYKLTGRAPKPDNDNEPQTVATAATVNRMAR